MCVKKNVVKYDFSWIENSVKKFQSKFKKKGVIERCIDLLPRNIIFWSDYNDEGEVVAHIWTHLDEEISDIGEYCKLRKEFEKKLIDKYSI